MPRALIDGDLIGHRAAFACQTDVCWTEGGPVSSHADAVKAAEIALYTVDAWAKLAERKDVLVCFTGRHNFRRLVMPSYKHNRSGKVKPLAFLYCVKRISSMFPTQLIEGLEADDLLGIEATAPGNEDDVIVSTDKDMATVPGLHCNPGKDGKLRTISVGEADHSWLLQTLTGDPSDGYAGIPGIGPAKGSKILDTPFHSTEVGVLWPRCTTAFVKAGLTLTEALSTARIARILRTTEYLPASDTVMLWHPECPEPLPLTAVRSGATTFTTPTTTPDT